MKTVVIRIAGIPDASRRIFTRAALEDYVKEHSEEKGLLVYQDTDGIAKRLTLRMDGDKLLGDVHEDGDEEESRMGAGEKT